MTSIFTKEPNTLVGSDTDNRSEEDSGTNESAQQGFRGHGWINRITEKGDREARMLRTTGDAFQLCQRLVKTQLEASAIDRPDPNQAIRGDGAARLAFLLLLTDWQQRRLFLQVANDSSAWPRLRPLFGAPPYNFLHPEDAGALRAGGFASARSNMAYEQLRAANVAQFGPGQFVDQHTREYRIVQRNDDEAAPIGSQFFASNHHLVLQVKVKKQAPSRKRALLQTAFKKQLFFPQPGETLVLQETKSMLSAMGVSTPTQTVLRVRALYPRAEGAATATVALSH